MKRSRFYGRRTKIVCTIGPATSSAVMIERLIRAGMDVARLNLSHGKLSEHARYIQTVRKLSQRLGIEVAVLMDLPGPKCRTGKLKGGQATLKKGALVVLTPRRVEGDAALVPVNLSSLPQDIKVGDTVLLDDGAMQLKVQGIDGTDVRCRVVVGGLLTEERGLVIPGMHTSGPFITDSLRQSMLFAIKHQPDYLALSFVSSTEDVAGVKAILQENNADIPIIAKIERGEAVRKFDSILQDSDGIRKCNQAGKPVITATEMLESMVSSARPTRAETTDVANAIFDGTDATMLSAETSIGKYPVQSVRMMAKIAVEAEKKLPYEQMLTDRGSWLEPQTDEIISYNACNTAHSLGAVAIVAFTQSGSTAGRVSKYRPRVPILAITPSNIVSGRLLLRWGVYPLQKDSPSSVDELFITAARLSKDLELSKPGDLIVITAGIPLGETGSTNLLKVHKID